MFLVSYLKRAKFFVPLAALLIFASVAANCDITKVIELIDMDHEFEDGQLIVEATFKVDDDASESFEVVALQVEVLEGPGCPCTVANSDPPDGGVGSLVPVDLGQVGGTLDPGETFDAEIVIDIDNVDVVTLMVTPCADPTENILHFPPCPKP